MAVADGAMAEAIRVSNLAGALLLQMEPPKTLEEVRLEVRWPNSSDVGQSMTAKEPTPKKVSQED